MAKGFGNTWWGSRWLLSLTHIDYENRIPRGATYARAGAVREIKIKGNVISAKVKGRRPRAYSVTIIVPPFFPENAESANSATRNSTTSSGRPLRRAFYACSFSDRSARLMAGIRSSSARF